MLENILRVLANFTNEQVEIIVAFWGLCGVVIVAVIGLFGSAITIMLNKKNERKIELRKIKEAQYADFLGSLAEIKAVGDGQRKDINRILSARIQTIYLVGSKDVQEALNNFLNILTCPSNSKENQSDLYGTLIMAMKRDLYGKNKKSLKSISYVVFSGE